MHVPLYIVDAFAARPFAGNPAAVCLLNEPADEQWMQGLAMEMNQAETSFLYPTGDGYHLRWFTPTNEVDLCGHATLASAHVLWETGVLSPQLKAVFSTKSGKLVCSKNGDSIEMDFPAEPAEPTDIPEQFLEQIEARPIWFGRNRMDYMIELVDERDLLELKVDISALSNLEARGFIFTAQCKSGKADFISRFFAPSVGVPEDSVTGSAHCCLGPYWAPRLNKQDLVGYQASKRAGYVGVSVRGDRVLLSGQAVTVVRGEVELS